jgi:chemotaxis protein MotB
MLKRILLVALAGTAVALAGCARIDRLEKANANLKGQVERLRQDKEDLAQEAAALKQARKELQASLAQVQQEAGQRSALVAEMQRERQRLQQQTQELRALLEDFGQFSVEPRGAGNYIVMQSEILFELGKIDLSPEATASLDKVGQYLLQNPELPIRIDGHTDGVPITHSAWKDNYHLSVMRAHAVMQYLTDAGVSAERIHIAGFGPNRPRVDPEAPQAPESQNRRVEIMLVPEGARSIAEILEDFGA